VAIAQVAPDVVALREALKVEPPSAVVRFINLLVYGEAGVGKTTLVGSANLDERLKPLLIFDVEGGMTTLKDMSDVDVVTVRSMAEIEDKYNKLYHSISDGEIYYKTIGIDSLPELADLDMRTVMKQAYQRNPETVHIDVPSPREWGIVRNHVRLIVRAFRDLPCHVVFTAGLGIDMPENQPPKFYPGFAGKLAREVPGFADIVGYMSVKNDLGTIQRSMQVIGTNRVVAKDRTNTLGSLVENPTLSMIWDRIEGKALVDDPTQVTAENVLVPA
jgi:AAA domain